MATRVATLLGFLVAIVGGFLALAQLDVLQTAGEAQSGAIGTFFESVVGLTVIVLAVAAIGSIVGVTLWLSKGR